MPTMQQLAANKIPVRFVGSPAQRDAADKERRTEEYVKSLPEGPLKDAALFRLRTGGAEPAGILKAPDKPAIGSFEDYVVQRFGARPTDAQIKTARKDYQQADDRPLQPQLVVVQTTNAAGEPVTRIEPKVAGKEFAAAPTAEMRSKQASKELVSKSINAIKAYSDRVLTKIGPAQRAEALQRGAAAVFGSDPEFKTYQDARLALAGNLAVSQQGSRPSDADIKQVWLPLVPDPYSDTAESAKMKWQLIETTSGASGVGAEKPKTKVFESGPYKGKTGTLQPNGSWKVEM
jgi:hypothetical protein